ncbi:unnamed protein product [Effrenium voratum]|nr:unnamed protein product [Effrenium voratum]
MASMHASRELMQALASVEQPEAALDLLQKFTDSRADLNEYHISAAFKACAGTWDAAMQVWGLMAGVSANVICFNSAMHAFERTGKWEFAVCILSQMFASFAVPDVVSFNTAISACAKSRAWAAALGLFRQVFRQKLEADQITFNSVLAARDDWGASLQLLEQMGHSKVARDGISFNTALVGPWQWALSLQRAARTSSLRLDVISYASALGRFEDGSQWWMSAALLTSMLQDSKTSTHKTGLGHNWR